MPFTMTAHGLRLLVKVSPKAASDRFEGLVADADGGVRLKLAVTAAAEAGRANAAAIALLARVLDLPSSLFALERGATGRRKTINISGDAADLAARISARINGVAEGKGKRR